MSRKRRITPDFVIDNIDFLREIRTHKGLTRQKFAYLTGVSLEMIAQYENCTCLPKKRKLQQVTCPLRMAAMAIIQGGKTL